MAKLFRAMPINPFGRGNMSKAAIDWVTGFDEGQLVTTPIYYAQQGFDLGHSGQGL